MKPTISGFGGWLQIYWTSILGQLKRGGLPTWWLGDEDTNSVPYIIGDLLNVTQGSDRASFFWARWWNLVSWLAESLLASQRLRSSYLVSCKGLVEVTASCVRIVRGMLLAVRLWHVNGSWNKETVRIWKDKPVVCLRLVYCNLFWGSTRNFRVSSFSAEIQNLIHAVQIKQFLHSTVIVR